MTADRDTMDASASHSAFTEDEFVTEADWVPAFWNYLLDLERNDLIAELIQNDLDQDATRRPLDFSFTLFGRPE